MKKLVLIATLALMTSTAFAQKHMVRFYDFDNGSSGTSSFDVSMGSDDVDGNELERQNIALNYAYAINNMWQVGVTYKNHSETRDGDSIISLDEDADNIGYNNYTAIGLSGYYNFDGKLDNTSYVGLHYTTFSFTADSVGGSTDDTDATRTDIAVEYGRRWNVGSAWGMNLTYAPSVTYTMGTYDVDSMDDDVKTTDLSWNFLKFDLLF